MTALQHTWADAPERPTNAQEERQWCQAYYYACGRNDSIAQFSRWLHGQIDGWIDPQAFADGYMRARWACRAGLTASSPSVQDFYAHFPGAPGSTPRPGTVI